MPTPREIAISSGAAGQLEEKAEKFVKEQEQPRDRDPRANPRNPAKQPAPVRVTRG